MKKQNAKTAKSEAVAVTAQAEQTKAAAKPEAPATLYVAGPKVTKPGTFFARVQALASQPTTLAAIITGLQTNHKEPEGKGIVPKSRKDHDMVIRVRCNYAASHGILVAAPTK